MNKLEETRKNAIHYRAIDYTNFHISRDEAIPWELATSCESGGSHRMDISTSVHFKGVDPQTGFTFSWTWDLEPWSANGKGYYELDVAGAKEVMRRLPATCRKAFEGYLQSCIKAVRKKGEEWEAITKGQFEYAKSLESILR
jgi:hypothetical protein